MGTCDLCCWHPTGVVLTSYPAQTEERCCRCGRLRFLRMEFPANAATGHGPFHPQRYGREP